jgi:hypothetical protein
LRGKIAGFEPAPGGPEGTFGPTHLAQDACGQTGCQAGVSASASQEREASSSIAGEPPRKITYLVAPK